MSKLGKFRTAGRAGSNDVRARHAYRLDDFLESYVRWRERSADVAASYERWAASSRAERNTAFSSYRRALDREELAADIHRHHSEQLRLDAA